MTKQRLGFLFGEASPPAEKFDVAQPALNCLVGLWPRRGDSVRSKSLPKFFLNLVSQLVVPTIDFSERDIRGNKLVGFVFRHGERFAEQRPD